MIEQEVYDYLLENCIGKKRRIKNYELMKIFNVGSDKSMRKIIQNIREDKNFPLIVGSIAGINGGNFICCTEEEILETINHLKHRANQMLRMTHVLEWKSHKFIVEETK